MKTLNNLIVAVFFACAMHTFVEVQGAFPNMFKQGKEAFAAAAGGESNPFVKGMQEMEDMFGTDDWQQKFHDTMIQGMEESTKQGKEQMESWMAKFNELKEQGASKDKFEQLAKVMQQAVQG